MNLNMEGTSLQSREERRPEPVSKVAPRVRSRPPDPGSSAGKARGAIPPLERGGNATALERRAATPRLGSRYAGSTDGAMRRRLPDSGGAPRTGASIEVPRPLGWSGIETGSGGVSPHFSPGGRGAFGARKGAAAAQIGLPLLPFGPGGVHPSTRRALAQNMAVVGRESNGIEWGGLNIAWAPL